MALKDLKTIFTSIKYGHDRPGDGSSSQPYVRTSPNNLSLSGFTDDFILRGGIQVIPESGKDTIRLSKFFFDPKSPKGTLFIVKQNLLSRIANKTQASRGIGYAGGLLNEGIYNPVNTLAQVSGVASGLHLPKQGLLPFVDEVGGISTYNKFVTKNQSLESNRLIKFYQEQIKDITGNPLILDTYGGGPGSILGIGKTIIRTASDRTGLASGINFKTFQTGIKNSETNREDTPKYNISGSNGASDLFSNITLKKTNEEDLLNFSVFERINSFDPNKITPNLGYKYLLDYNQTQNLSLNNSDDNRGKLIGSPSAVDFRTEVLPIDKKSTILSFGPNYKIKNIENRVNLGDPGNSQGKNLYSYSSGTGKGALDKINAKLLYTSKNVSTKDTNDLVKFRIAAIDSNGSGEKTYIHFRALIDSFNDSYSSDWSGFKYPGRGENFYTYSGFDRKISMSWTIYAQSREELIPMYKKLNYLASNLAPDYSNETGYMRGPLVSLTLGGLLYEQPGFITSLVYDVPSDSTWEIGITDNGEGDPGDVKELPHMIKVTSFNFTPIHQFLPRKVTTPTEIQDAQFIALNNGITNNY